MNEDKQLQDEGLDWLACVFWSVVIAALVLGAVFGHSAVSSSLNF